MANMRMTLETILEEHRAIKATMDRVRARSAELTTEGMKAELERSLSPHRVRVEKITTYLNRLEEVTREEAEDLAAESLSLPKMNATERVAAEMEARRVLDRGPLDVAGAVALVGPVHESVSLPARVIVLEEAMAAEVVTRDLLLEHLRSVSPLYAEMVEKARTVREVLNSVHRPVVERMSAVVHHLRTDRLELPINYPDLLDSILDSYRVDTDNVAGVPALNL